MFLIRLIYASAVSDEFDHQEIEPILEVARKKNYESNITGLLCFNNKFFLQCLEGSRSKVNATYQRILNDPRHDNVVMLDYKEIYQRDFDSWSMGYIPKTELTRNMNMRFSPSPDFNPYEMSGESAHRMMLSLRDNVPSL
jgi:hypothetical protein